MSVHSRLIAPYLENFGTDKQKARLFPDIISGRRILAIAMTEPDAGSDLAAMKTRAVERDDHWLLNGSKIYISNGLLSDIVIVAAKRSEEHTSELQSLMRISYAVFCLKKKNEYINIRNAKKQL